MYIFYLIFIALFIVFAGPSIEASRGAVSMFLFSVLPSLLPFFIVSDLLLNSSFPGKMSRLLSPVMRPVFGVSGAGAAALLPGLLCGYPVGAAACADLYGRGLLSRTEAERLSAYTSNTGPFFVVGAVGAAMCRSPGAGIVLLVTHIAAGLITGVFFRFYKKDSSPCAINKVYKQPSGEQPPEKRKSFGYVLGQSISKSVLQVITVGGFIIIFAVIIGILKETHIISGLSRLIAGDNYKTAEGLLSGLIELTNGCSIISSSGSGIIYALPFLAFVLGFGGFSVHAQVISILNNASIRSGPFILGKTTQALLAAFFTYLAVSLDGIKYYIINSSASGSTGSTLIPDPSGPDAPGLLINIAAVVIGTIIVITAAWYMSKFKGRRLRKINSIS